MSRLTWCSNLLPGEELSDHLAELSAVLAGLSEPGPQSRHRGVGLRLAAKAADELLSEGERGAAARHPL